MESAHSSMPQTEDFDDPFSELNLDTSAPADNVTETQENNAADTNATEDDDADPWAVLAAAAGEEAPAPEPETQQSESSQQTEKAVDDKPSTSFAQGETFSMPQTQSPYQAGPIPIEGLSLLGSQIQSHASNLSRTLSAKFQEVDAKHGISQKVTEAKHTVEEKYHISEKMSNFHTQVVKPAGDNVVEKVVPSVKEGWGVVSSTVRQNVANLNSNSGAGIDSVDGEMALNQQSETPDIRQKWASVSSAVGNRWSSTAAVLGEKAEVWKESHMQWREEHMKKMAEERSTNRAPLDVKETFAGGMNWVSQRFKKAQVNNESPVKEQSVVSTLIDMDSRKVDSDGIPSSFMRD